MNLRDIIVYCDTDLRIRKGCCKEQDGVGTIVIAAMHKSPRTLFSFAVLLTAFFRPFVILVIAALSISIELEN